MSSVSPGRVVLRSWWLIALLLIAALVGGFVFTKTRTPQYEGSAKVYVAAESAKSVNDLAVGGTFVQQILKSYADIATTSLVLDKVIDRLQLDTTAVQLGKDVSVTAVGDESVLQITVTDTSSRRAVRIADAIGAELAGAVSTLSPKGSSAAVKVTLVQQAVPSDGPVSPSLPVNLALAVVIGLLLGLGAAFLRQLVDDRIRNPDEAARITGLPVLGRIHRSAEAAPVDFTADHWDRRGEDFRALRTNLDFVEFDDGDAGHVFLVTSPATRDGKTTVAVNLASALAGLDERVLLIDADLRKPGIAKQLQLTGDLGLTDVLVRGVDLMHAVQSDGTLHVLSAGSRAPNPSELLQGRSMLALLESLRGDYRFIIIDGPPVNPVTDSAILAKRSDGVLAVIAAGRSRARGTTTMLDALRQVDARLLGVVVTMLKTRRSDRPRYGVYGATAGEQPISTSA